VFLSSSDGNLYTHQFDLSTHSEPELILVETVLTGRKGAIQEIRVIQDWILLAFDDGGILMG
jgi:hypothetical protein